MEHSYKKIRSVILAGGRGKRMGNDDLPKTLSLLCGKPIIHHLLSGVIESKLIEKPLLVIGFKGELIKEYLGDKVDYVIQEKQLGTGHAVSCACAVLDEDCSHILVLNGDHPFVFPETVNKIIDTHLANNSAVTITTTEIDFSNSLHEHLHSYGRVFRNKKNITKIIEVKDATLDEQKIKEVNVGFYCLDVSWVKRNINKLSNKNAQGEYYITDLVGLAVSQGEEVSSVEVDVISSLGINTKEQLLRAEKIINSFLPVL